MGVAISPTPHPFSNLAPPPIGSINFLKQRHQLGGNHFTLKTQVFFSPHKSGWLLLRHRALCVGILGGFVPARDLGEKPSQLGVKSRPAEHASVAKKLRP